MPSSPRTPRHSPHPSLEFQSSASSSPQERRYSKSDYPQEPSTPLRNSFNPEGMDGVFSSGGMGGGADNGLGNLADELADMLSDGEEDDEYYGDDGGGAPDISFEAEEDVGNTDDPTTIGKDGIRDSVVDVESPADSLGPALQLRRASLALPPNGNGRGGHRRTPSEYDGSEYGSDSDLDSPGMPPKLVEKIDEVESLARRGSEHSPADGAFKRVTDGLRDLSSQSGVEGGATRQEGSLQATKTRRGYAEPFSPLGSTILTRHCHGTNRLITAHSALTTHLSHQTRQLHSLTFSLLSPLVAPPDSETIDQLLPMLVSLSDNMPRPSTTAFNSLASLHSITSDLVQTLNYLSDTLHMSRQTTTTAARRLKSAKELVAEMKEDEELREQGERWLTRGDWGEKLRKRECAHVCGEVVGGFEEVCNSWRQRLVAQAAAEAQTGFA
ncbi:hypothetical protein B0H66DRAFT_136393 [Apodospora peruviana]|uniref:Uncharacterized protein n=1 Tax=Apodospora peruviana TaxID=516989 RepID=A0AAE0MB71_9PEZI|nr:hypothetical protein B0H66DRAFT_136393 [Apodospora peruviana]